MDIGEKRAILQSIGADIVLVEREIGKAKNGRVLTAKFIEVEPYPWLDFLEKSSKKLAPILCKGLNSHLQGELGQKSQLYCAWLDRQDINNAPLSQATGHWTNLGLKSCRPFFVAQKMAGPAGFEPANAGTKTQCLTAWRRSNLQYILPQENAPAQVRGSSQQG